MKTYRTELARRKAELLDAVRDRQDIAVEQAADEIDAIQLAALREQAITQLDRESRLLREVEAALRRIESGDYGICEDCEEEISQKRLKAVPWARRCLSCQDAADGASYPVAA